MTFTEWLAALDAIAEANGVPRTGGMTYTERTGPDCWLESYDDGDTPQQAWDEDTIAGVA